MRQVLNTLTWGSMAIALAIALPACVKGAEGSGETESIQETGSIQAALTVGGARHDVTSVHYAVVGANGTCADTPIAETTSALETEELPGGVLPPGSGSHAGADGLFVLPPGDYRVCATPMSANGPSAECPATQGPATVISGATTEILLVAQCAGDPNGGVDVVVALNDPPKITALGISPSKFIIACETATITATGADPDGDAITFSWTITDSPAGSAPRLQSTDGTANFATDTAGDYQLRVSVTDVHAASSALTFPIHVSALSCAAQDQCHTAGACDLNTGACSNPPVADGTACDDGDGNTSSDVCTSGVCAGSTASCTTCPAGSTPVAGGCARSYDIDASLLVNQDSFCDSGGIDRYNGCNGAPYGFQWSDAGGQLGSVNRVDVDLETGISCTPGGRTATLNGVPIGSFNTTGSCDCFSFDSLVSLPNVNSGAYVHGGVNSVTIPPQNCEGLSQSPSLNGAYARVTVTYTCGVDLCAGVTCAAQDQCHQAGSCDPATGACSNPPVADGTACDDGDASTSSDVCTSGVCAGSAPSCTTCPAGFTAVAGGCARSYDIDAALLVNQDSFCDAGGVDRYNGCNGAPYGFQWADAGGQLGSVNRVDVDLETGITCTGGSRTAMLNGVPVGGFNMVGSCDCFSFDSLVSLPNVNSGAYVQGGVNSVTIPPQNCEGLSQSPSLNGAYARVTVTYSCGPNLCAGVTCVAQDQCHQAGSCDPATGACSNPTAPDGTACNNGDPNNPASVCLNGACAVCGDNVCNATESCQSCPSDCGACITCGDGICSATESCQSCPGDCGACVTCGDGICDASESCQSCPGDCGACSTCPGTNLGSTVPQSVAGATLGGINTQQGTCGASSAPDVTFGFTAPSDGTYQLDTFGSDYDTVLYVRDGSCGGAELACNDDSSGLLSAVTVNLTAGQTIVIVVDGFSTRSGNFVLNIH